VIPDEVREALVEAVAKSIQYGYVHEVTNAEWTQAHHAVDTVLSHLEQVECPYHEPVYRIRKP
jgi:hypothetical protein